MGPRHATCALGRGSWGDLVGGSDEGEGETEGSVLWGPREGVLPRGSWRGGLGEGEREGD